MALLKPKEFVTSIYHIDLERLYKLGMRGIITDLDNTLVEWNSPVATPKLVKWLDDVRSRGMKVCILSNNDSARVSDFASTLNIPALHKAGKPMKRAYLKAMRILATQSQNTVMVGDQVFTDVLGGNRLGLYTILVKPIHPKEYIGTKALRVMERWVLKQIPDPGEIKDVHDSR